MKAFDFARRKVEVSCTSCGGDFKLPQYSVALLRVWFFEQNYVAFKCPADDQTVLQPVDRERYLNLRKLALTGSFIVEPLKADYSLEDLARFIGPIIGASNNLDDQRSYEMGPSMVD